MTLTQQQRPDPTPSRKGMPPYGSGLTYTLSRQLYTLLLWLLLPFALFRLYWKSKDNSAYRSRVLQRLGFGLPKLKDCILVHAVSVGETVAAVPFLEQLIEQYPSRDILVTSTTPTGSDRVQQLFAGRVEQCFLPFDTAFFMARLLRRTRPALVIIIETEIWPNLIYQCHKRRIPVLLANARLSERSYQGYRKLRWLAGPTLQRVTQIAAHATPDLQRFLELGADNARASAIGSIKFDLTLPLHLKDKVETLRQTLPFVKGGKKPFIWVAASTHDGEETIIIKAAKALQQKLPDAICIIVPRHTERFETVARLLADEKVEYQRFSLTRRLPPPGSILLGDTMGELLMFYSIADAAFVGGSLVPVGGHNVLESLACQTATLVGPYMFNFSSIHGLLMENKAIIQVETQAQLTEHLYRLATNELLREKLSQRGEAVVQSNRGALDRLVGITHRLMTE